MLFHIAEIPVIPSLHGPSLTYVLFCVCAFSLCCVVVFVSVCWFSYTTLSVRSGSLHTSLGTDVRVFVKVNKVVWMAERLMVLAVRRGIAEKRPDGRG